MNWYKQSQASFQTFNLEDKIINSFTRSFKNYIAKNGLKSTQAFLTKNHSIQIGSANISEALKPIIEHYGKPQSDLPKRIDFVFLTPDNPFVTQTTNAVFTKLNGKFLIGKVIDNLSEFTIDDTFKNSMAHEIQHLLKALYEGRIQDTRENYYEQDWEIQAIANNIARNAIESLKNVYNMRIRNMSKEQAHRILLRLGENRNELISMYLVNSVKDYFKEAEKRSGKRMSDEARRKYYIGSIRNFNRMLDEFIGENYELV